MAAARRRVGARLLSFVLFACVGIGGFAASSAAFAKTSGPATAADPPHHLIICHATGSATNPYVAINISIDAWVNGHSHHDGDFILKDPAEPGEKADDSACNRGSTTTTTTTPTTTTNPTTPTAPPTTTTPTTPTTPTNGGTTTTTTTTGTSPTTTTT